MSRNDIVLLAWGSRSMSSVALAAQRQRRGQIDGGRGLPDAAFLVGDGDDHQERDADVGLLAGTRRGIAGASSADVYILYLPRSSGIQALEPLVQPVGVGFLRREVDRLGVVDDVSSTKIGARVRSASAIASLGRASMASVSPFSAR